MATLYATRNAIKHRSEKLVFDALTRLDDDWHVFYSVPWFAGKRAFDGEADFLLLHRKRGLLVLEAKGGDIELDAGVWTRLDHKGRRKPMKRNPLDQVQDNAYELKRRLEGKVVPGVKLGMGYAIVIPAAPLALKASAGELSRILWTGADLRNVEAAVASLCRTFTRPTKLSESAASAIISHLAPTVSVSRATREAALVADADLEEATCQEIRLNEEQVRLLERLRGERRAIVYGRAGTGKTLMALARAQRLADEGARVLLTCSRSALATTLRLHAAQWPPSPGTRRYHPDSFRYQTPADVESSPLVIESFKALVRSMVPEDRRPIVERLGDAAGASPTITVEGVADALALDKPPLDAVVVDEGQQFLPLWFAILETLMVQGSDGPMYVFADDLQAFAPIPPDRERWVPPFPDEQALELKVNCRNTVQIVKTLAAVGPFEIPEMKTLEASGPEVELIEVRGSDQALAKLEQVLEALLDDGHDPDDIAIVPLALSPQLSDGRKRNRLNPRRLVNLLSGEARFAGRARFAPLVPPVLAGESRAVRIATSREFQGFESRVVIVLATTHISEAAWDWTLREAYIAMSRARTLLVVICSPQVAGILRPRAG